MKVFSQWTKAFIALVATISMSSGFACTCMFAGVFAEFAEQHPIIVRGTIHQHGEKLPNNSSYFKTMTVVVSETVKGTFPHTAFEFYGDTGMSCLRYIALDDYPIGSEHLFILESEESLQPLMVCGESSLLIQGDSVQGHIRDATGFHTYELKIDDLIERVR